MKLPYRNHLSDTVISKLRIVKENVVDIKPHGFWYGIRDEWYNYMIQELGSKPKHIYEVKLFPKSLTSVDYPDKNKVVKIHSKSDVLKLNKYVKKIDHGSKAIYDWSKLMNSFGGIEILNPRDLADHDHYYLYSWDVSSGCIWNIDIIRAIIKN